MAHEALETILTVVERQEDVRLETAMTIVGPAAEALTTDMTVVEHDFMADTVRTTGILLEMEDGAGAMLPVPLSELGEEITLTTTLDGNGVSELAFSRVGGGQGPMQSGNLRAPRRVRLSILRGTLGGERTWQKFDGYLRDVDVDTYPARSDLQAQDGSLLDAPLFFQLAARSHRTRKSVWAEICQLNRIIPGAFHAPGDGGHVVKEITEAGGKTILAFFNEFLAPTGYQCHWNGRSLDVVKFAVTDTPVRVFNWSDFHEEPRVTPPATNTPNSVRVASGIYGYTGPDLTGTVLESIGTPGPYTPVAAIQKQDHATGAITSISPVVTPQALVSLIETQTTRYGGNVTGVVIKEYGWAAPKACNKRQLTSGAITYNNQFTVYKFPDDTWRTQDQETWQLLRMWTLVRSFSDEGFLFEERRALSALAADEVYIGVVSSGAESLLDRLVLDDGRAWNGGKETFRAVENLHTWPVVNDAGQIVKWEMRNYATTSTAYVPSSSVWNGVTLSIFGPSAARRYSTSVFGTDALLWFATETLTALDDNAHTKQLVSGGPLYVDPERITPAPAPYVQTVEAPLPLLEQLSTLQVPQPAFVTQTDRVRAAFAGKVTTFPVENAWCESMSEMNVAAFTEVQRFGACDVALTTDVDPRVSAGSVVTIPEHPELGNGPQNVLVRTSTITLNLAEYTGEHKLECWWLSPELR